MDRKIELLRLISYVNVLTEKYEAKYKEGKSGAGDTELSADNTEVLDNEELLESECTDEESNGDSTEIK